MQKNLIKQYQGGYTLYLWQNSLICINQIWLPWQLKHFANVAMKLL